MLFLLLCCAAAPVSQPATQSTAGGWTVLPPGAHQVHVSSSSGSDSAADGSADHPYQTLGKAVRYVRDGDDLLLQRGDVFYDTLGGHKWSHVTIGAYGTGPRPTVSCDTTNSSAAIIANGTDVRFVGLHLTASHRDPSKIDFKPGNGNFGIYCMNCNDVLIEDCLVEYFADDIAILGNANKGFRLRRSVVRYAYSHDKRFAQGIFLDGQADTLVEDCIFDTCGWNPILEAEAERRAAAASGQSSVVGGQSPRQRPTANGQRTTDNRQIPPWIETLKVPDGQPFPGTPNMFNHGVYDHDGGNAGPSTVRNCIFVNCAASGMTQGVGGTIDNCLFIHNGLATDAWTGGEQGSIANCVCLGSHECPSWAVGGGLTLMSKSGMVQNNIVAHGAPAQQGAGLVLWTMKGSTIPLDAKAAFQHNIVYDWPAAGFSVPTARSIVEFTNNCVGKTPGQIVSILDGSDCQYVFESNQYEQSPQKFLYKSRPVDFDSFRQMIGSKTSTIGPAGSMHFADPCRTIEGYAQSIGLKPALHEFVRSADSQSRDSWNPKLTASAVNDYIRAGFAP